MARAPAKPAPGSPAAPSARSRLVVLHGPDRFKADTELAALRAALAKAHGPEGFDTVRFDGAAGARIIADILDECRSVGLMQQHKIVLVDNADQLLKAGDDDAPAKPAGRGKRGHVPASARELLENYAGAPSDAATLVLRSGTWRPGNLDKAILAMPAGAGSIIKCEPMTDREAVAWVQQRAASTHGTSVDATTAGMLVDAVGTEMGRLDTELEKLALAAGGEGQPITPELVSTMVGVSREEEFWSIQSSLISGDASRTLGHLRELIEVSRHDPVPIAHSYAEMARKVHVAAHALARGARVESLAYQLKIFGPPDVRNQQIALLEQAAASAGVPASARLLAAAVASDAAGKSGLGDPVRNLETLTIKFNAVTQRRRRG
jgi:DNA polymerase III delta subunit